MSGHLVLHHLRGGGWSELSPRTRPALQRGRGVDRDGDYAGTATGRPPATGGGPAAAGVARELVVRSSRLLHDHQLGGSGLALVCILTKYWSTTISVIVLSVQIRNGQPSLCGYVDLPISCVPSRL